MSRLLIEEEIQSYEETREASRASARESEMVAPIRVDAAPSGEDRPPDDDLTRAPGDARPVMESASPAEDPRTLRPRDRRRPRGEARGEPRERFLTALNGVNRELWIVLSLLALAGVLNYLVAAQRLVLGFFTLPTLVSAYYFGRRHAVLTAFASVVLVGSVFHASPNWLGGGEVPPFPRGQWFDILCWSGTLLITAFFMGTLCDRLSARMEELRETYHGLLMILRQFLSRDRYTENHSYRVSVYAANIATQMGFPQQRIEETRAAAMLHDIGKLDTSRELLHKAASHSRVEYDEAREHVEKGAAILSPVSGPLHRIIPIILAHHDRYDGGGHRHRAGGDIPLESRIIAVADVYDALTSDRPYRKAMSPFEARSIIEDGSGSEFDPRVVRAFLKVFQQGKMEIPDIVI